MSTHSSGYSPDAHIHNFRNETKVSATPVRYL